MHDEMSLKEVLIRFKPFYKRYWKQFAIAIFGMLLASGGTAGSFYALEPILNYIFVEKNESLLYTVPFLLVLMYFFKNFGTYLQSFYVYDSDFFREFLAFILKYLSYSLFDIIKKN